MALVYKCTDLMDGIVKYIGIVTSNKRSLRQRMKEHLMQEEWFNSSFMVEYIDGISATDAKYMEAHFISYYHTGKYYNKDKREWGLSQFIDSHLEWKQYYLQSVCKLHGRTKKRVIQYSLDGIYIKTWNSVYEIVDSLKYKENRLRDCCQENKYSYKGYIWRYEENFDSIPKQLSDYKPKTNMRRVALYSLDNMFIKMFDSLSDAARYIGVSTTTIYRCCNNNTKCMSKYIVKYA